MGKGVNMNFKKILFTTILMNTLQQEEPLETFRVHFPFPLHCFSWESTVQFPVKKMIKSKMQRTKKVQQ